MKPIRLGILKEGKKPIDRRVPLTPKQCLAVQQQFPHVSVYVQSSAIRAFADEEYRSLGLAVAEDVSHCDLLMGVKEVNVADLIPNKKYGFFSHTYKEQPYNRSLLKAILDKKIQLIDYELLTDKQGNRLVGFGRYAGIVGCYNGFRAFGQKQQLYALKPAYQCKDRAELWAELQKVTLPRSTKIVATGMGRVGRGAREIFAALELKERSPSDFLTAQADTAAFTHLQPKDYFAREDGKPFDEAAFFKSGAGHISTFQRFLKVADMYVACHYWDPQSPYLFTPSDISDKETRPSVIADISCDIDGPVPSTIRTSTIEDPFYGYSPKSRQEVDFMDAEAIGVMAVDNLPCELPRDASEDFGNQLIEQVFPALFGDDADGIVERASQTNLEGRLNERFTYLTHYVQSPA